MKKLLVLILSVLLLCLCAAFTACKNNQGGESGNNTESGNNSGSGSGDGASGDNSDGGIGSEYKAPVYDENLPQNYFGTYYIDSYVKVVNGIIVAENAGDNFDANSEFSTENYNVTVFSDNSVCMNFGGKADRRGAFLTDKKTLAVKREYFSNWGVVEMQYDENLKFEFLNGELVLTKTTNGYDSKTDLDTVTLQVYAFKKGADLSESDYPVTVNDFNGTYVQKHKEAENYIEATVDGNKAKVKRHLYNGKTEEYDGAVVFRPEGDEYKIIIYFGGNDKTIVFDYALNVISDYDKIN